MAPKLIGIRAILCALTLTLAAPAMLDAQPGPPPHAQAKGHAKPKKVKKAHDANAPDRGAARVEPGRESERRWDPRFQGLDRDRDDVVSRREWQGDDRSFREHDWNRDGVLSGDELVAGARRPERAPEPARHTARPRTESDEVLFARQDVNHDGRLSRNEWTGLSRTFDRLDVNRDGVLSPYEFGVGR